ncbi:hypothetical protein [Allocoleopsis franciscana]|uniref:Uncharacterized protein n=1 Tax=Allocoleopsis franciscana PCC 7113 TaxID=1173027 RepID=K9WJ68_9CYAN|nr:hypothetical protein [Allocoleopsis franciscana]AFZ19824.1 hypothetical protein Mic7113_4122 [Allocoleopsis franciscana PCC 7113]
MNSSLARLADTWTPLIVQYKTAGDLLLSSDKAEAVVLPATFLYRQCIELLLKRHILIFLEILQLPFAEFAQNYQKKHSLNTLFRGFQQLAEQLGNCKQAPEHVALAITYFQNLDPDSVSLRYPLRSDGSVLQVTLTQETLHTVRSHIKQIAAFFNEQYAVLKAQFNS